MYKEKLLKSRDEIDHFHKAIEEYSKYAYICTVHKASKLAMYYDFWAASSFVA